MIQDPVQSWFADIGRAQQEDRSIEVLTEEEDDSYIFIRLGVRVRDESLAREILEGGYGPVGKLNVHPESQEWVERVQGEIEQWENTSKFRKGWSIAWRKFVSFFRRSGR